MPEDIHLFTAKRRRPMVEWCNQVPVVGSTYGRYDLNVIKEHFAEVDIEIPKPLWMKFEEMTPFFFTQTKLCLNI